MRTYAAKDQISIGFTGASGAQYGLRLVEYLVQRAIPVNVLFSKAALVVLGMELDISLSGKPREQARRLCERYKVDNSALINVYGEQDWHAPIASGSNVSRAMVVCPCSTGTLAAIATGQSNNLIERAADVSLKERKPLILVVRETPLNIIHLENMLRVAKAGGQIMPANPGFYHKPVVVEALIDFMVARILDQLNIEHDLMLKWGESLSMDDSDNVE